MKTPSQPEQTMKALEKHKMNKNLKLLAGLVGLLLVASTALAQLGEPQTVIASTNLALSTSTAITQGFSAVNSPNMTLAATLTGKSAGVTNPGTITFQKSIDNSGWTTGLDWLITPTGVTATTLTTNIVSAGYPYWRTTNINNSDNTTNLVLVLKAAKDLSGVTSLRDTIMVGGVVYTNTAKAAATQVALTEVKILATNQVVLSQVAKPASTQVALTVSTMGVTAMVLTNGLNLGTNYTYTVVTGVTVNAAYAFASDTPQVIATNTVSTCYGFGASIPQVIGTATVNTVWGLATTTPDVLALTPQ